MLIELEDCVFHGKLLHYQLGRKEKPHKPTILIVESQVGKVVLTFTHGVMGIYGEPLDWSMIALGMAVIAFVIAAVAFALK